MDGPQAIQIEGQGTFAFEFGPTEGDEFDDQQQYQDVEGNGYDYNNNDSYAYYNQNQESYYQDQNGQSGAYN